MAMGHGLYAQVVMIRRRESDIKKEKEKTKKYNFQIQSARLWSWFDIYHEWLEENFRTRGLDFYRKLYQTKLRGDYAKTFQIFGVKIDNAKIIRKVKFQPAELVIKYHQNTSASFCLSSLSPGFHCINDNRAVPALINSTGESLTLQIENCKNIIHFDNAIISNRRKYRVNVT